MPSPRLKLPGSLIRLAYRFLDVEASGEAAPPDGRIVEYAFVIGKLGQMKQGRVLDVGCTARLNYLPASFALLGWEVWGIDQREWKFSFPNFHFVCEDIRRTSFPDNFFDCVYALSTLEHIGLSGRYGTTDADPEGDIKAVREIARILCMEGRLLVTVPYAKRQTVRPGARVYAEQRLLELFSGWEVKDKILYGHDRQGFWMPMTEEAVQQTKQDKEAIALLELICRK